MTLDRNLLTDAIGALRSGSPRERDAIADAIERAMAEADRPPVRQCSGCLSETVAHVDVHEGGAVEDCCGELSCCAKRQRIKGWTTFPLEER